MATSFSRTLNHWFSYHAPNPEKNHIKRYEIIRNKAKEFSLILDENCPQSRELSNAYDALRGAVMWANASIAVNETDYEHEE